MRGPGTLSNAVSDASPSGEWRERLVDAIPAVLFVALLAGTYRTWVLPFQDAGRELMTAERLAHGEVLYRDVVGRYGPLPPYVDAALVSLWRHVDALILLRTLLGLAGMEALRRLACRVTGERRLGAAVAATVVAACFFLPCGGAVPFPYSAAALEGAVGCWWALELALASESGVGTAVAALIAGLAAGTKLELFPAALLSLAPPLLMRRPRREAVAAILGAAVLGLSAWILPISILGAPLLERQGFLFGGEVPAAWRSMYSWLFWGGRRPEELLSWPTLSVYLESLLFVATALVLAAAWRRRAAAAGLFAVGFLAVVIPGNAEFQALIPLAVVLFAGELVALSRGRRDAPALCVGVAMLVPLARQPMSLLAQAPYSAFSAPLALVFVLALLSRRVAASRNVAAFLLGLSLAQGFDRVSECRAAHRTEVSLSGARLRLLDGEAKLLVALVDRIRLETPPGSYVAGFPEGGLVLFLAGRRSPFPDDQFHPGAQDRESEEEMIRILVRRRISAGFVLNRRHVEFGGGVFGRDYDRSFFEAFQRRMVPAAVVGEPSGPRPACLRADQALFFLAAHSP